MRTDDAILDDIIKDGSANVDSWPELNKRLIARLENIAHNAFPQSYADIDVTSVAPVSTQSTQEDIIPTSPESFSQDKNGASMAPPQSSPFPSPKASSAAGEITTQPRTLHPEDQSVLNSLTQILSTQFEIAPPHTVQRLAELFRYPNAHYQSLPKYLRALQRVLSVSSNSTAFPLPPSATEALPNGSSGFSLGSDESLGGALLSPIPWLTSTPLTENLIGAAEAASNGSMEPSETVINGVSQGELLRQEQELNIIPAAQVTSPPRSSAGEGPPALGPADVGPQPEGTIMPDPPATLEEARSPLPYRRRSMGIIEAEVEVEVEVEEEMKDAPGEEDENQEEDKENKEVTTPSAVVVAAAVAEGEGMKKIDRMDVDVSDEPEKVTKCEEKAEEVEVTEGKMQVEFDETVDDKEVDENKENVDKEAAVA